MSAIAHGTGQFLQYTRRTDVQDKRVQQFNPAKIQSTEAEIFHTNQTQKGEHYAY